MKARKVLVTEDDDADGATAAPEKVGPPQKSYIEIHPPGRLNVDNNNVRLRQSRDDFLNSDSPTPSPPPPHRPPSPPATTSNIFGTMVNVSGKMASSNGFDSTITTGYGGAAAANGYGDSNAPSSAFSSSKYNGSIHNTPAPSGKAPIATPHANGNAKATAQNGRAPTAAYVVPKRDYSREPNSRDIVGYVGFANIPNQVFRRAIKQGFDFTMLVVGQSGLGKSTFVNSLFLTDMYADSSRVDKVLPKTTQVKEQCVRLVEDGVQLNLTLVDTPGFGDSIDNSKCWQPVIDYVDRKYGDYFTEETKIARAERIPDRRVHCCLYFIAPGHGLKALDIEFMRQLHERVNIVPVIAKADTMTPEELTRFKRNVLHELKEHNIKVYQFPDSTDEDEQRELNRLRERVPFAIIGSNLVMEQDGKKVRCRKYPWGVVEVENLEHNDFIALRNMLIRTYLIDLIDVTSGVHYENFRVRQMMSKAGVAADTNSSGDRDPFTALEQERRQHDQGMDAKKKEMERILAEKTTERERGIARKEQELQQQLRDLQTRLAQRRTELETGSGHLAELKRQYPQLASDVSRSSLKSGVSDDTSPESHLKKKKNTLNPFSRHNRDH